jgi:hypothetical protein
MASTPTDYSALAQQHGAITSLSAERPLYMAPGPANGLVKPGNVDLTQLQVIDNGDGSYSTVYGTSFTDENEDSPTYGKEVLVRGIINGKKTDDIDALREKYAKDGQTLGVFKDGDSADQYAQRLHQDWEDGKIPGVQMATGNQQGSGSWSSANVPDLLSGPASSWTDFINPVSSIGLRGPSAYQEPEEGAPPITPGAPPQQ